MADKIACKRTTNMRVLILLFIVLFAGLVSLAYLSPVHRWGDASTYYMMIDSITYDGDIKYEHKDIQRAFEKQFDDLPAGLYLVKDNIGNLYYAKEYTYSLIASLFFWLIGNNGILVFNSILLFIMILMGYFYLRLNNSNDISFFISVFYFIFSTAFIYLFWVHADLYINFLVMLAFFLCSSYVHNITSPHPTKCNLILLYLSAIVFGIAAFSKMPNFVGVIPIILYESYFKRYKNVFIFTILFLATTVLLYGVYYLLTGNYTPYNYQYYYVGEYPFWGNCTTGCGSGVPVLDNLIKPSVLSMEALKSISLNFFYYFFGRFTGAIWYCPFILLALFLYFRDIISDNPKIRSPYNLWRSLILVSIIINIFIYLYLGYDSVLNYFGGGHAVGNRYFYFYPVFLFLIYKIKFNRTAIGTILIVLSISALFVIPLNFSPIKNSASPMYHTLQMPYRMLPLEYTQLDNLPLWDPIRNQIENDTIYFPLSNIIYKNNWYLFQGAHTEVLIKSYTRSSYKLHLISHQRDTYLTLQFGNYFKYIELKQNHLTTVTLTGDPIFLSRSGNIYDLNLYNNVKQSQDDGIFFTFADISNIDEFMSQKISPSYGWKGNEIWNGILTRWMQTDATLQLNSSENHTATLSFNAQSFYRNRTLEIYSGEVPVAQVTVPTSFINVSVPMHLAKGANTIRLHVPEGCERPSDKPELNNPDSRCLSVAMQNLPVT